ncbi:glycine/sarcosine/betaine reductase component B subunit [Chloroflexota bacterium]
MRLELGIINIKDIQFGDQTNINEGTLYINREELISIALQDVRLSNADVKLARPGEEIRIVPVKDVIEPRVKIGKTSEVFPGMIGKLATVGSGITNVAKGVAVITTGRIIGYQEGLIDMSGAGAPYSQFSLTNNVVLVLQPRKGISPYGHEEAIRLAGLRSAAYLGEACRNYDPDETEIYELNYSGDSSLPRVAYIYGLLSQGLLHDTYIYGIDAKKILPTLINPNEIMDGAIVSGNCVSACDKNTTYHHMNNAIIKELYRRHGKELDFVGVIITNLNVTLADKERSSDYASKLAKIIGAEGVIISKEGFGNPDTDLMMLCRKMDDYGIKTVFITDEYAGRDGESQSLADSDLKANAVISAGNANELIKLSPMKYVIGELESPEVITGGFVGCLSADGGVQVELQGIIGSTCQLGFNKLRAREY